LPTPSLEAVRLTKRFGSFPAVTDLNLKIEGSKCVGFLGPNGAGKTTTLKMFTDLIRPSSGQALINGVNVYTNKKQALASVAALIETPEVYPALTPREALRMIAEIRGVPVAERNSRIEEAVKEVHMEEWIDKRVGKFSKGMKQRINVASALLSNPSILLLDEPTTGLDPRGMTEVREIVKSLKDKKRLIFMSSHLLSEVAEVCDEVALIDHGKLIVYNTIHNVTAMVAGGQDIVEAGFAHLVDKDYVTKTVATLPGVTSVEKKDEYTLILRFSGGLKTQERLLSDLVKLNIGVVSYKSSGFELEDVYLKLIRVTV
jgi:ABC-2 type transport system ATP-binding protein